MSKKNPRSRAPDLDKYVTVFDCEIPMSVRAAETSAEGSSRYVYDPKGKLCGGG